MNLPLGEVHPVASLCDPVGSLGGHSLRRAGVFEDVAALVTEPGPSPEELAGLAQMNFTLKFRITSH